MDIAAIKTVVNYDVARDIDTHTHRIGRTGRAGEKGTAYTLMTLADKEFAPNLVRNLEHANQIVSPELLSMAMQVSVNMARIDQSNSLFRILILLIHDLDITIQVANILLSAVEFNENGLVLVLVLVLRHQQLKRLLNRPIRLIMMDHQLKK